LTWHAERTYQDYWAGLDQGAPYYRKAGALYLSEARSVLPSGDTLPEEERANRLAEVVKQQTQLDLPDNVAIYRLTKGRLLPVSPPTSITDEPFVSVEFGIKGPPSSPKGMPVLWADRGPGLDFRQETSPARKALAGVTSNPAETRTRYDLILLERDKPPLKAQSTMTVHGFFRGRYFTHRTPVALHYRPDLEYLQPEKPRTAGVAVQARKDSKRQFSAVNSHLIIILDCSDSMDTLDGDKVMRFTRVLKALELTLEELPDGITLSLYTFGARSDGNGNVVKRWPRDNKLVPWKQADRKGLMDELRSLENKDQLAHSTPLIKALYEVRNEFQQGDDIAKMILALTDGVDQADITGKPHFPSGLGDPYQRGDTIEQFLKKAFPQNPDFKQEKGFGVHVSVVGVEVGQDGTPEWKEKVNRRNEEFQKAIKAIGGDYILVNDAKTELATSLGDAMFRVKYFVDERSGTVPADFPRNGADVSGVEDNLRPILGFGPGTFNMFLRRTRAQTGRDQWVSLDPGDLLVLRLESLEATSQVFRRVSLRELLGGNAPYRDLVGVPWHLGVLQNQEVQNLDTREGYEGMIAIEKKIEFTDSRKNAYQPKPGEVWMALRSTEEPGGQPRVVPGLRINPLYHYPAPAWSLYVQDWPRNHRAVFDIWWTEEDRRLAPAAVLERDKDFRTLADLVQKPVRAVLTDVTQPQEVTVESASIEKRKIEVAAGEFREEDCLVVRLSYPDGTTPFFARLPREIDQELKGQEHRFYTEPGKYTGIFWPVSREKALNLKALNIMSVEELKRISHHAPNWELGPPDEQDRPQPLGKP
jgi:hypothetical protein